MSEKNTEKKEIADVVTEAEATTETVETKSESQITFVKAAVVIMVVGVSALVAGVVWINKSKDLADVPAADIAVEVVEQEVAEIKAPVVDAAVESDVAAEQEAVVEQDSTVAIVDDTQKQAVFNPYVMPNAQAFNDMVKKQREAMRRNMNQRREMVLKDQEKRRQQMLNRVAEFKAAAVKRRAEADERFIKMINESRAAFEKSMQKGI